jgi:hypothetical protein
MGVGTALRRGPTTKAFKKPRGIVTVDEFLDDPPRLRQVLEPMLSAFRI